METILFHSNILSERDVPFINRLTSSLESQNVKLILTGWNNVLPEWNLQPTYFVQPSNIIYFKPIFNKALIESDFIKFNLSIDLLVERFNWWFPLPKMKKRKRKE